MPILVVLITSLFLVNGEDWCDSKIYCHGNLLHTVQMAQIFNDSKNFVDLKMRKNEWEILSNFQNLMNKTANKPNREEVRVFVRDHFENFTELKEWTPSDFRKNPKFVSKIRNKAVRKFAQDLVDIWPTMGRKVKQEVFKTPQLFSLIPIQNGFIIPGGRFKEFYYWDTYWVIKGLLLCEMYETVKGMLENFLSLVEKYGFIPNGSRVYYLNRSQPPLLSFMIADYISATNNTPWLKINIKTIEKELQFWLTNRVTEVEKNGTKYILAHYSSSGGTPRPESYYEDVKTAAIFDNESEKRHLYLKIKAAAESGWDFSSRWIIDENGGNRANLTHTDAPRIIPVDLNSFLCKAFRIVSKLYTTLDDHPSAHYWLEKSTIWRKTIEKVLYDEHDGIWYDFDQKLSKPRKYFYPSNLSPLWTRAHNPTKSKILGHRAVKYLLNQNIYNYTGGIPASLIHSKQQWDLPNAWPPLQHIVVLGLEQSGDKQAKEMAKKLAKQWINANLIGFTETGKMFEKYDAEHPGQYGGGGEYDVQTGFGWTNGVILDLIRLYYT